MGVFKQAHMVVATSFSGEGGWVERGGGGGASRVVGRGRDFTQSVLSGIEEASS